MCLKIFHDYLANSGFKPATHCLYNESPEAPKTVYRQQ